MLNFEPTMSNKTTKYLILILALVALMYRVEARGQFAFQVEITSPSPGEAIQGLVPIVGTSSVDDFEYYTIDFSIADTANISWFNLLSSTSSVENEVLAEWDTSSLTDGNYDLKLTVFRDNKDSVEFYVRGLRIRNYSPIETSTAGPTDTPNPERTATPAQTTAPPTPTDLPQNNLVLSRSTIRNSILFGVFSSLGIALIIMINSLSKSRNNPKI